MKSPSPHHPSPITLLVGLGNPGKSYDANRHNVGFMALAAILDKYRTGKTKTVFGGALCECVIAGRKYLAFFPLGYMNTSGGPVGEVARFYKIAPEQILVFHDELDLPLAKIRVKRGGGNGGHNGLKSLDAHIGKEYLRVRIGIAHPGDKDLVSDYVLSDFSKAEQKTIGALLEDMASHAGLLLQGDEAGFMNKIALAAQ